LDVEEGKRGGRREGERDATHLVGVAGKLSLWRGKGREMREVS